MAHNEASLMKLNKENLVRITLDYQGKFNNILDDLKKDISDLKSDLSGLKSNFSKLEADIQVSRNVNSKLPERLLTMERRCYANEQYSRTECLEISGIPESLADKDLESKVLEILEEIDVRIDPNLVEDCHHLPFKGSSKKVIVKLNRRKDIHRILSNKNKLKNLKPESVHLPGETKVFINESLCLYYKKLWSKCKSLWSAGHISAFWVRNGSLRIKLSNGIVSIITHDCDLKKLFPYNSLIEDK